MTDFIFKQLPYDLSDQADLALIGNSQGGGQQLLYYFLWTNRKRIC